MARWLLALAAVLSTSSALAASRGGVTLPDTVEVGGQQLILNGIGVSKKAMFQLFVVGLYLPAQTTDRAAVLEVDGPRRLVLHLSRDLPAEQIQADVAAKLPTVPDHMHAAVVAWTTLLGESPADAELVAEFRPGAGVALSVSGQPKGTLTGADDMKAILAMYVGDAAVKDVRNGLLGQ
ncbi:MAG: hypothetical protein ACI8PZ_001053 [Myxococcota bacterium]|jgi:hypothetical protein